MFISTFQCSSSKENRDDLFHARKPKHDDSNQLKEKFIHAKVNQLYVSFAISC
jgi:hypothetical protein